MKTTMTENRASVAVVAMLTVGLALIPAFLHAATWNSTDGGTYSWNVDTNPPWDTGSFPNGIDAVASLTNNITGNQTINLNQGITLGSLTVGDSNNTHAFTIAGNGGALTFNNSSGTASLTQTSTSRGDTIAADMTLASDLDITNNSASALTISGDITEQGGSRAVTLSSAEPVVLNGNNSYSGGTDLAFLADPDYVEIGTGSALGSGAVTTTGSHGRIRFNLSEDTAFSQDMHLLPNNSYALYNAGTGTVSLNGNLSGGSTFYLVSGADGNGGFSLSGNNTAIGHLVADNTTLTIENTSAIAGFGSVLLAENWGPEKDVGKVYLADGVNTNKQFTHTLYTDFNTSRSAYLGMSEAGAATISGTLDLNGRDNVANTAVSNIYLDTPDGATLTLSGIIKNTNTHASNNLVKIGDGTVVLSNTNTYGGATAINAGILKLDGTGSINATSGITVNTGGTFITNSTVAVTAPIDMAGGTIMGTGTIGNGAGYTLNIDDGYINPGNSPGTLTINGNLIISDTLQIEVQDNGSFSIDKLKITGNLDITGATLQIIDLGGGPYDFTIPRLIAEYQGDLTGTFASITGYPNVFQIAYGVNLGGLSDGYTTGIYVYIPEPSTLGLACLCIAGLFSRRPRSRR